jgi:flavorubredoxin
MLKTIEVNSDITAIAAPLFVPGRGILPLTAMLLRSKEPMLIDTGAPIHRSEFLETLRSLIDPADIRWIFISHDDRDHTGNLIPLLDQCPRARVVTTFVGVGRMSEEWSLPMDRVYFLNDGDKLNLGDREIMAIRPPFFDAPGTRGVWDPKSSTLYSVDTFGAPVEKLVDDVEDVPREAWVQAFQWFNRVNHSWFELVDPKKFEQSLERIRSLAPANVVSFHGPVARNRTPELLAMLRDLLKMEPVALPDQKALEAMLASMR